MSEKFELIRCDKNLKLFSYPVNNSNEKERKNNFFIGNNDIWHNGIHFTTENSIKSIADGEIIAYRISDSYKSKSFDIKKVEILEDIVSYAIIDPYFRVFFDFCFILTDGVYKLKNNASDKEKEQALFVLGKLYSDSFVLIKHSYKNSDKKEIEFFSLYNHLSPLTSLTYDEKLVLFYFNITIKLSNITPYTKVRVFNIENNSEQFIPSETAYSNALGADEIVITWSLNNTEYMGVINKKVRRDDTYHEIRRPGKGSNYLKQGQYRNLNDGTYLLFNKPDKSSRNVKAIAQPNDILSINYQELLRYVQNVDENQGLKITHPVYKECYIYLRTDYRRKLRDFINEKVLTQLQGPSTPTFSFSYKKGFVFHTNQKKSFTLYMKKNPKYEPWLPLLPELDKSVVDIKNVMIKKGDSFTKINLDYIPCETRINTKTNYMLIKWTINGKENKGFIKEDFVRSDINEIKRKRYPFDKANNNLNDLYSLKENNYVLIYNNQERRKRQVIATVSKDTELYIDNNEKKEFIAFIKKIEQKDLFDNGIKVNYKRNKEIRSGYIFLDFNYHLLPLPKDVNDDVEFIKNNKTNMFLKQDSAIGLFQKDVKEKLYLIDSAKSIEIGKFLTINCKLENNKNKIVQRKNKKIKKDSIIGFSGYYCNYQDEKGEIRNEKKALPIHFETFIETDKLSFMDFEKQDNVLYPAFCKIKNSIELHKGELKTKAEQKDISSLLQQLYPNDQNAQNLDSISNVCLKIIKTGKLVEGEVFYEVKIIGKIIPFEPEDYILRSDINWDKQNKVYYSSETKNVEVYNFNASLESSDDSEIESEISNESDLEDDTEESRIVSTGKTISLDKEFFYPDTFNYSQLEGDLKDNKEMQNALGIINFVGSGAFDLSTEYAQKLRRPEFYCEKIDNNEIFYISQKTFSGFITRTHEDVTLIYIYKDKTLSKTDILSRPEETYWSGTSQTVNSGNYEYNYKTIKEYSDFDSNELPKTEWREIEKDKNKFYCDDKLIKYNDSSADVELVYYDEWKRFFKEIKLSDFGEYKCKKENRAKLFEALGITGDVEKSVCDNLKDDNVTYNLYFENETEWKKNNGKIKELKKIAANSEAELKPQTEDFNIFKEISKLFKKATRFVYFQPCAFLNHLDKVLGLSEFNPYEGKGSLTINANGWILQSRTQPFLSNPGFAPYNKDLSADGYEYNGLKYAYVTCLFDVKRQISSTKTDIHTGIDLGSWQKSAPIKAFIKGTVLECTWNKTKKEKAGTGYGNMMLIEGDNGYLYLLAHLTSYLKEKGDPVLPGDDVAMSGQTGNSTGYHLHLEIIKPLSKSIKTNSMYVINQSDNQFSGLSSIEQRNNRFNPFDHNDKFGSFSGGN